MKNAVIQLEPLTCPSCIKKIETTLNKIGGVNSVKVLFNSSKIKTQFDDSRIGINKITDTVEKLGYSVLSTKLKESVAE